MSIHICTNPLDCLSPLMSSSHLSTDLFLLPPSIEIKNAYYFQRISTADIIHPIVRAAPFCLVSFSQIFVIVIVFFFFCSFLDNGYVIVKGPWPEVESCHERTSCPLLHGIRKKQILHLEFGWFYADGTIVSLQVYKINK